MNAYEPVQIETPKTKRQKTGEAKVEKDMRKPDKKEKKRKSEAMPEVRGFFKANHGDKD